MWLAARADTLWDYPADAGPPIDALAHLRIHEFLEARPVMGPLSIILRAPFAALGQLFADGGSQHGYLSDYRFGIVPCLVVAGVFGIALARIIEQRGGGFLARAAVVVLVIVNPVSTRAIKFGHPEEMLGAALLAGAAVAAVKRRPGIAAVLLALAIVTKQWALIGAPAVLVAMWVSSGWETLRKPLLILVGIALLLTVPLLIVDARSLFDTFKHLADIRDSYVFPASIWYPFGTDLGPGHFVQISRGLRGMPDWLGTVARPLIAFLGVAIPLMLASRVAKDPVRRALPLLALIMLLRCALDPANNGYYHVPFLFALIAADALTGRFYATAAAVVFLQAPTTFKFAVTDLNVFYICWAVPFAVYLAGRAYGANSPQWLRLSTSATRA